MENNDPAQDSKIKDERDFLKRVSKSKGVLVKRITDFILDRGSSPKTQKTKAAKNTRDFSLKHSGAMEIKNCANDFKYRKDEGDRLKNDNKSKDVISKRLHNKDFMPDRGDSSPKTLNVKVPINTKQDFGIKNCETTEKKDCLNDDKDRKYENDLIKDNQPKVTYDETINNTDFKTDRRGSSPKVKKNIVDSVYVDKFSKDSLKKNSKSKSEINKRPNNKDIRPDKDDLPTKGPKVSKSHDVKSKSFYKSVSGVSKKNVIDSEKPINRLLDINEKKRIREKYTFKSNTFNRNRQHEESQMSKGFQKALQNDSLKKRNNQADIKEKLIEHPKFESTKTEIDSDSKEKSRKHPVIKTITAKHDATKIYKAVIFTEQRRKCTPLQINIPTDTVVRGKGLTKATHNHESESRTSVKTKATKSRYDKRKRTLLKEASGLRDASPDSLFKDSGSPPTEVAKWSLSSADNHTKPYYEAWVNTTLAALSTNTKKNQMFLEKGNIIKTFKRILEERPRSPELVYEDYLDERYTGKIKVTRR